MIRRMLPILVFTGCATGTGQNALSSKQNANAMSDTVPSLFGAGVVSTGDNEFSTALTRDNSRVYWTLSAPNVAEIPFVILYADRTSHGWSTPRVAPFSGTGYSDGDPAMAPNGHEIFFMSRRPVTGTATRPDFDIWVYDTNTGATRRIDEVSTDGFETYPSVTNDGTLYFTADRAGGFGASDIYRSRLVSGRYTTPENIGGTVNTAEPETNVFVAPDESYLIVSSPKKGGRGGSDLYISERNAAGEWTTPRPLDRINTAYDEYAPTVSLDGRTLYFTTRRRAPGAGPVAGLSFEALRRVVRGAGNGNADIYSVDFAWARGR